MVLISIKLFILNKAVMWNILLVTSFIKMSAATMTLDSQLPLNILMVVMIAVLWAICYNFAVAVRTTLKRYCHTKANYNVQHKSMTLSCVFPELSLLQLLITNIYI